MNFINKTISRKIIFWMFILMTISSVAVMYSTISKISEENIESINQSILDGNDGGVIFSDGAELDWEIIETNSYLDEKVEILESKDRVVFENNQLINEVFLNSEGDYEYNIYDLSDFANGDTLDALDGGCCTGSSRDAVYMAIGE